MIFKILFILLLSSISLAQTIQRGPYLQMATPTSIIVQWRTNQSTDSAVRYGIDPVNLFSITTGNIGINHSVVLSGLFPNTRYYYSIGTSSIAIAGDLSYTFTTPPVTGSTKSIRIWVLGDSGTAGNNVRRVRDAYMNFVPPKSTDLWLLLGDIAYTSGTDIQYQVSLFDIFPEMLRQSPVWPTFGNHDAQSASSVTQSGPYYDIFTLPKNAEAGGIASDTEAFYSFNYSNIHFIVLDSQDSDRNVGGKMLSWLERDLMDNQQHWVIVMWHHPPYSKGSHNSDNETPLKKSRENTVPILERYGVDMVLTGHSHGYERSFLIDGHYGIASTFNNSMKLDGGSGRGSGAYTKMGPDFSHKGAVYAVAGSASMTGPGSMNHPAMFISFKNLGSMILEVNGDTLQAKFLNDVGLIQDYFTIIKNTNQIKPNPPVLNF